jgi:2'-5' RNA ligase
MGTARDLAYRFVVRARSTLGIQRAANFRRLEIAFVLPLDDDAHNYMRGLQVGILKRIGATEALTAPPHLTLKLGFKAADPSRFDDYLDELARATPPFEIRLTKFDRFDGGIVFLDVEPNAELDRLRRRVVRELSERFGVEPRPLEGDRFHFHATLAYGLSPRHFASEFERVSRTTPNLRCMMQSMAILCHTGDHWFTYRRARLSGPHDQP